TALDPGRLYRFTLRTPDGALAGSWAFQAAAPLNVVTTVPGDQATNVPVDTGIEMTFDQDGIVDVASHFSIRPAAAGTFEQHGRTVVFVPDQLLPATLYTVTLTRGVTLEGSDQVLGADRQVRFETAPTRATATSPTRPARSFGFDRAMIEVWPGVPPTIAVSISASSPSLEHAAFAMRVYRLPSEPAGIEAVRKLSVAPYWATWSKAGLVSTTSLTRVSAFNANPVVLANSSESTVRFPSPLSPGWYLVEIPRPDRPAQTVLQVTDIAAYSAIATNKLLVWANDTASRAPLAGASVAVVGGDSLGRTDASGLLVATTPASILDAASGTEKAEPRQLVVRTDDGRSLVVPVGIAGGRGGYLADVANAGNQYRDPAADYWRSLATDRGVYRQTDTINLWGYLRSRDGAALPNGLSLILTTSNASTPIATVPVKVDRAGAYAANLPFKNLPYGGYTVQLTAGDLQLGSVWVNVEEIRKPSYSISLTTNRHVMVAGDPLTLTAQASFFDGTPVPNVDLAVQMFETGHAATTDGSGTATVTAPAVAYGDVSVRPARSEEADIHASTYVTVFPASIMIEAQATIDRGQIDLRGTVNQVAVQRLEAAWPDTWSVEAQGPPVGNRAISVEVVESMAVRTKTHHVYDFISKRVVNTYDYRWDEVQHATRSLTSAADGSFRLQFAADPSHTYEMRVSARDNAGREADTSVSAYGPARPVESTSSGSLVPYLAEQECRAPGASGYRTGDPICLQMLNDTAPLPTGGDNRYLFFAARRGLQQVVVQDAPVYNSTFEANDVPNVEFWGVRFSGATYTPVEWSYRARFDSEERRITVSLTSDRKRYAPGDTVNLHVRTTNAAGNPIAASVVLRAVDEKIFAMGDAWEQDPLSDLYAEEDASGLLWTHGSHPVPFPRPADCGCGDTSGGGGDRSDFADAILFRKVATDTGGRANLSFKLSDDLTSWHISASATTGVPEAGAGSILIPVGLPFFVDATLAPEYLAGEHPTLRIRAFGSSLGPADRVTYTVSSTTLGMPSTTVSGLAFGYVDVPLPNLSIGDQAVTISGTAKQGGTTMSDRLTRRFSVIASRLTGTRTSYAPLTAGLRPDGGAGRTTYVFSDAGRGRYLSLLQSLSWSGGLRVDQAVAAALARDLLVDAFAVPRSSLGEQTFQSGLYQGYDGVALLPYSSPDLGLTVRAALLAGDRFDQALLGDSLQRVLVDPASTRERRMLALAGLAGTGRPVLADLRLAIADPNLTVRERLYLGLGAAALGDDAMASSIERDVLGAFGERRGPWLRLQVGESLDDTIEATSLAALLAADLGEPFAPDLEAYVDANPAVDDLHDLQQVAFVTRMLDRTPSTAARFAYVLAGKRRVVDLGPGQSFALALLEAQRQTLSFVPLTGSVSVATTWQVPLDVSTIGRDPELVITRTVLPEGVVPSTSLVEVRLTATFGSQVVSGCYAVTDLVPSGMAPLAGVQGPPDADPANQFVTPFDIEAQRVSFCVAPNKSERSVKMRYFARIVGPGEYAWEPAVIQSTAAAESLNLTAERRITIR
ncbi:MAG: alpha-2-macroglobulin, partial [Chloroflexota bacterium]|nr:alpha-2-macroglobulin [Chloroflexota bacterium]